MTEVTLLCLLWEGNFRSALLWLEILLCEGVARNIFVNNIQPQSLFQGLPD